jgi:hypothetical protein
MRDTTSNGGKTMKASDLKKEVDVIGKLILNPNGGFTKYISSNNISVSKLIEGLSTINIMESQLAEAKKNMEQMVNDNISK